MLPGSGWMVLGAKRGQKSLSLRTFPDTPIKPLRPTHRENNECDQDYWDFSHLDDQLLLDFPPNNHHVVQQLRSRQNIQESIRVDGTGDIVWQNQSCGETDLQSSQRSGILSQRWSVWSCRVFVIDTGPPIHSNGKIEGNLSYLTDGCTYKNFLTTHQTKKTSSLFHAKHDRKQDLS